MLLVSICGSIHIRTALVVALLFIEFHYQGMLPLQKIQVQLRWFLKVYLLLLLLKVVLFKSIYIGRGMHLLSLELFFSILFFNVCLVSQKGFFHCISKLTLYLLPMFYIILLSIEHQFVAIQPLCISSLLLAISFIYIKYHSIFCQQLIYNYCRFSKGGQ